MLVEERSNETVDRRRLTWREEMGSIALAAWMVAGLFLDGWAHNNNKPETIFTPWHAVFYSGFLALAAYTAVLAQRYGRPRPPGLSLMIVGLVVFGSGAVADLAWHRLFGIEVGLDALLSPTHLVMFVGGLLILGGPFQSHWATDTDPAPGFRDFLPALLSLTLAASIVAFFFMYLTPFLRDVYGTWIDDYRFGDADDLRVIGLASLLVTNVISVAPVLFVLRRWRPPFGAATVMLVSMTGLVGALDAFGRWYVLLAAVPAGLVADVLIHRLPAPSAQPWSPRIVAAATSVVLWSGFFAVYEVVDGVGWSAELWTGAIVMAALSSLGLGLVMFPPRVPAAP